ncbi:MAG: glutathione S-transferase family protein [Oligoflexales bacterium]|nr:glutathione S-transferase family protein [Oligoflexales bacterium]
MITLYAHSASPYSQRVRFLLEELKVGYELVSVNLKQGAHKTKEFQSLNPFSRVPCLVWEGEQVSESLAICRYVIEQLKAYDFYPKGVFARAQVDQWVDYTNIHLGVALTNLAWHRHWCPLFGLTTDNRHADKLEIRINRELPVIEKKLSTHRYLVSSVPTLCDFSFLPQIWVYDKAGICLDRYPNILAWIETMSQKDSWKKAVS